MQGCDVDTLPTDDDGAHTHGLSWSWLWLPCFWRLHYLLVEVRRRPDEGDLAIKRLILHVSRILAGRIQHPQSVRPSTSRSRSRRRPTAERRPTAMTTNDDNDGRRCMLSYATIPMPPTTITMHPPSFRRAMLSLSFHTVFFLLFLSHHAPLASASAQLPTDEHGDYDGSDIIAVRRCKRRYMIVNSSSTFVFSTYALHFHSIFHIIHPLELIYCLLPLTIIVSHSKVDQISPRRNHSSIIAHWSRNSRQFQFLAGIIRQLPSQTY